MRLATLKDKKKIWKFQADGIAKKPFKNLGSAFGESSNSAREAHSRNSPDRCSAQNQAGERKPKPSEGSTIGVGTKAEVLEWK